MDKWPNSNQQIYLTKYSVISWMNIVWNDRNSFNYNFSFYMEIFIRLLISNRLDKKRNGSLCIIYMNGSFWALRHRLGWRKTLFVSPCFYDIINVTVTNNKLEIIRIFPSRHSMQKTIQKYFFLLKKLM